MSMAMNSLVATLPLAIALLGGNIPIENGNQLGSHTRVAATYVERPLQDQRLSEQQKNWLKAQNPFGIPIAKIPGHRNLIVRQGYSLAHNNIDLIADWVAFHLTTQYVNGTEKRPGSNAFKADPKLRKGRRAELSDYKGWNGVFDRGHQVANKDSVGRGITVVRESFFLTNMTPQASKLNRGGWNALEGRIRKIALNRRELWVITGPVFVDDDGDGLVEYLTIGTNQVAVPTHYFKIVLSKLENNDDKYEAMAFLIPNQKLEGNFDDYLVSVDQIERLTGLDFFSQMNDVDEDNMEASIAKKVWEYKSP